MSRLQLFIRKIKLIPVAYESCLYLPQFPTHLHNFSLYVDGLTSEIEPSDSEENQPPSPSTVASNGHPVAPRAYDIDVLRKSPPLHFEPVLFYAEFPDLNRSKLSRDDYRKDFNEIFRVLDWISPRGVSQILKLRVPDRLHVPHEDKGIWWRVRRFSVKVLKWRKLNLYLNYKALFPDDDSYQQSSKGTSSDVPFPNCLKKLYLYTDGNRAVIDHWFSAPNSGGLRDLHVCFNFIIE